MLPERIQAMLPVLESELHKCLTCTPLEHLEVELRLGCKQHQRFDPHVDCALFKQVHAMLSSYRGWASVETTHTVDKLLPGGVRVQTDRDGARGVHVTRKTRLNNVDIENSHGGLDVRLSISTEQPMGWWACDANLPPELADVPPEATRVKRRTSFKHRNGWQFDLTRVERGVSADPDSDEEEVYEIELELGPLQLLRQPVSEVALRGLLLVQDVLAIGPQKL